MSVLNAAGVPRQDGQEPSVSRRSVDVAERFTMKAERLASKFAPEGVSVELNWSDISPIVSTLSAIITVAAFVFNNYGN